MRWAIEWRSDNWLDGRCRRFIWNGTQPHLFETRAKARAFIAEKYDYFARRPDLRAEPHGWRMPRAVKVSVQLTEVA